MLLCMWVPLAASSYNIVDMFQPVLRDATAMPTSPVKKTTISQSATVAT